MALTEFENFGFDEIHFVLPRPMHTPVGGYRVVYEYANELARRGLNVSIWHSDGVAGYMGGRTLARAIAAASYRWWFRGHRRAWRESRVSWHAIDRRVNLRASARLPKIEPSGRAAIIATAIETTGFVARVAQRTSSISGAFIQHFENWTAPEAEIIRAWSSVHRRIVIAPWLSELAARHGLDSVLIPNAINSEAFPVGAALVERPLRVVSLLSAHGYKRPDVVAATFEVLRSSRPDVEIHAFGQSAVPPVNGDFTYHSDPSPAALSQLFQSAQVYFCGSDAEGWHLPPAEATLSGAAVVSTDIDGVRASMEDDALYAPAGDPQGLATEVTRALADLESAQARVDRARARISSRTIAHNATSFLKALQA